MTHTICSVGFLLYLCEMENDPTIKTQENFTYTTKELEEMKEWDVTLMDGDRGVHSIVKDTEEDGD